MNFIPNTVLQFQKIKLLKYMSQFIEFSSLQTDEQSQKVAKKGTKI